MMKQFMTGISFQVWAKSGARLNNPDSLIVSWFLHARPSPRFEDGVGTIETLIRR